jgi:hypothetical protein
VASVKAQPDVEIVWRSRELVENENEYQREEGKRQN